jgi:hypothetical protein
MSLLLYFRLHAAHRSKKRFELRTPCWSMNAGGEETRRDFQRLAAGHRYFCLRKKGVVSSSLSFFLSFSVCHK